MTTQNSATLFLTLFSSPLNQQLLSPSFLGLNMKEILDFTVEEGKLTDMGTD